MTHEIKVRPRLTWEERWQEPAVEGLLEPLGPNHRRGMKGLIEALDTMPNVERRFSWFGPSWRWTIVWEIGEGESATAICYMILDPEQPHVQIPMADAFVESLPIRQLHKYVRDNIALAKQAVSLHWGTWSPTNQGEVEHLMDLIHRYEDWILEGVTDPEEEGEEE